MSCIRWTLGMLSVFASVIIASTSAMAIDEALGKYGQTEIYYESLDELKPLITLSVAEPKSLGLTDDKLAALKIAYRLMESQKANDGQSGKKFGKTIAGYQPLVERLLQCDTSCPMVAVLFADNEMIYPMIVVPICGDFEPVEMETIQTHNQIWRLDGDENAGLFKEDILWWGTRGNYVFLTVKPLTRAVPEDFTSLYGQYSDAETTLEVHFANAPKYLVFGLLQVADFYLRYGKGIETLEQYLGRSSDNLFFSWEPNESVRQTWLACLDEIRDYFRQIRRYKATLTLSDSGDIVITSTVDFIPETDLWRQMNARKHQKQSLHGFYRPEKAVFAVGEGGFLRPRQQKMILGFYEGIQESMLGMAKWQIHSTEQNLANLKSRDELLKENPDLAELFAATDFSTVDADKPVSKKNVTPFGEYEEILSVEENRPFFEKQLVRNKSDYENTKQLQGFFLATLTQPYLEGAATLGDDRNFIAATKISEGHKLQEFLRNLFSQMANAPNNSLETDMHEDKGFLFITVSAPVIPDDILELKPSGYIPRNVNVQHPVTRSASAQEGMPVPYYGGPVTGTLVSNAVESGAVSIVPVETMSSSATLVPSSSVVMQEQELPKTEHLKPVSVPTSVDHAATGQGVLVPTSESGSHHPFGMSTEEYNQMQEHMRRGEEKAAQIALERRCKAMENMPEELKNCRRQFCLGISEDMICVAVGLDVSNPVKALHDAIDRCGQPQEFDATLMVFRPYQMGEMFRDFAPLMLEASDADYHDFVKELLALPPETAVTFSTRFTETERIDTMNVGREYFDFYRSRILQQPNYRRSWMSPFLPSYLNEGGLYEIAPGDETP